MSYDEADNHLLINVIKAKVKTNIIDTFKLIHHACRISIFNILNIYDILLYIQENSWNGCTGLVRFILQNMSSTTIG